jgi:hypothetical protein
VVVKLSSTGSVGVRSGDVLPSSGRDRSLSAIVSDRPIVALEME